MSNLIPISDLPRGYRQGSNGEEIHRDIQAGDLVGMLTENWGDKLRYNLMTLQPELNGEEIVNIHLDKTPMKDRPLKGYIGLQDHGEPNNLYFRNIKIKEL